MCWMICIVGWLVGWLVSVGKWLACQAMDNKIMIFGVHNNFRLNRKKSFRGHMVAGYSCVPDFSPDGR